MTGCGRSEPDAAVPQFSSYRPSVATPESTAPVASCVWAPLQKQVVRVERSASDRTGLSSDLIGGYKKTQLFHFQACDLDQCRVKGDFLSYMGVEL